MSIADSLFTEAIERLERTRVVVHHARARLCYGEWLRRVNRRVDARRQLSAAHEMFTRMGAQAFAERARRELVATGEKVRKQPVSSGGEMTAQEAQIARLAGDGLTNQEIGAQLFISTHTVEWHLRKVSSSSASPRAGSCGLCRGRARPVRSYSTSLPWLDTSRIRAEISSGIPGMASCSIRPGPDHTRLTLSRSSRCG